MIFSQLAAVVDVLQREQVYVLLQFEPLDESAYICVYVCSQVAMYIDIYLSTLLDLTANSDTRREWARNDLISGLE